MFLNKKCPKLPHKKRIPNPKTYKLVSPREGKYLFREGQEKKKGETKRKNKKRKSKTGTTPQRRAPRKPRRREAEGREGAKTPKEKTTKARGQPNKEGEQRQVKTLGEQSGHQSEISIFFFVLTKKCSILIELLSMYEIWHTAAH